MEVVFSSERIDFILPTIDLVHDYFNMINDPNVYQYITLNHTDYSLQDEIDWVNNHQNYDQFSMIDRNTHEFIGNIGINEMSDNSCEIGIAICSDHQNNHYGREAISRFIEYLFDHHNISEITLVVFSNNTRAITCYRSVGFEITHEIPNVGVINGEDVNDIYMRILRN